MSDRLTKICKMDAAANVQTKHLDDAEDYVSLLLELEAYVRCYAWRPGRDIGAASMKRFDELLLRLENSPRNNRKEQPK